MRFFGRMSRLAAAMLVALLIGILPPETIAGTRYVLDATLDPAARTIAGTVDIHVENTTPVALDEIVLVLYPNRFSAPGARHRDRTRPYVYPREEFVAGGITIERLDTRRGDEPARAIADSRLETIDGWPGTLLRARLPAPLAPGAAAAVRASSRNRVAAAVRAVRRRRRSGRRARRLVPVHARESRGRNLGAAAGAAPGRAQRHAARTEVVHHGRR